MEYLIPILFYKNKLDMTNLWYDYPFSWEWNVRIPLKVEMSNSKEKIVIILKYKQANIEETIMFLQETKDKKWDHTDWFFSFLKEFWDMDKTKERLLKLWWDVTQRIFKLILDTRFRWVFDTWKKRSSEWGRSTLYSAALMLVCEKLSIDPDTFQKKYTIEQMNRFIKWISYNANEWSEEWRRQNDRVRFNEENNDEDLIKLLASRKK